jgi:hypothetical protein
VEPAKLALRRLPSAILAAARNGRQGVRATTGEESLSGVFDIFSRCFDTVAEKLAIVHDSHQTRLSSFIGSP